MLAFVFLSLIVAGNSEFFEYAIENFGAQYRFVSEGIACEQRPCLPLKNEMTGESRAYFVIVEPVND